MNNEEIICDIIGKKAPKIFFTDALNAREAISEGLNHARTDQKDKDVLEYLKHQKTIVKKAIAKSIFKDLDIVPTGGTYYESIKRKYLGK